MYNALVQSATQSATVQCTHTASASQKFYVISAYKLNTEATYRAKFCHLYVVVQKKKKNKNNFTEFIIAH